jgi:20S proteasome alpha/beta subunit
MTVIAYSAKHRMMAADSRCSDGYAMHLTNCRKIFRLKNHALLGTAGDSDDRLVRDILSKATPRKLPSRAALAETKTEFHGILVFPKGQVFVIDIGWHEHAAEGEWMGSIDPITDDLVAVGHGQQFAYGALEAGKNPRDAVRITCKRDTTCALPVQWETLDGDTK